MTLRIEHVSKTYRNDAGTDVRALHDVSLEIGAGMFGFLGPNGAGKSTLMRTIATLQAPDSGTIHFGDVNVLAQPQALRERLGYLPQDFGLYPAMTAEETLDHFATLKGWHDNGERRDRVQSLLQQVNLYDQREKKSGTLSGGMRQRLGIAIALVGQPKLLIVDEPTAGLDPAERNRFLNLLASVGDDVTVMLSTHIVEDVRDLCSQMAIIDKGEVVARGAPTQLLTELRGRIWQHRVPRDRVADLQARHHVISTRLAAGHTLLHVYSDTDPGDGFELAEPDLDDLYFLRLGKHAEPE